MFTSTKRAFNRGLAGQIGRGAAGSMALKISGIGLGFALTVILARVLGVDGYGIYAYVFSLVSILVVPTQFGLSKLVVRETAKAQVRGDWGLVRGVWRWSSFVTSGMSAALTIALLVAAWFLRGRLSQVQLLTFCVGIALIPVLSFGSLRSAALQGLRRVIIGQLPETVIRPAVLLLAILIVVFAVDAKLNATRAMALQVFAAAVAFCVGAWWLRRNRPVQLGSKPAPKYHPRPWISAILPFSLTAGMQMVNQYAAILLLGVFGNVHQVGIYRIAAQSAVLIVFSLQATDMFIAPYFARLHAQSDNVRLRRLVIRSGQFIFLFALPPAIIFCVWGKVLLGFVFGAAFKVAYLPLLILSVGQLINAAFGSVGALLNMTGYERDTLRGIGVAAGCSVVLDVLLIPRLGGVGAATATTLALTIWNVLLWRAARRRLGLETFVVLNTVKRL